MKKSKFEKIFDDGKKKNNLFVGSLSWNIDEEWLTREFEQYGEISNVKIIMDRDSGRSKGFVTYDLPLSSCGTDFIPVLAMSNSSIPSLESKLTRR